MTDEFDLLTRAREATWPGSVSDGGTIRARARRRQRSQWAVSAGGVCAAVALLAVVTASIQGAGNSPTIASDPETTDPVVNIEGAVLTLPFDWEILKAPAPGEACVGPADVAASECPVLIAVTLDPYTAPENGLDVVPSLMAVCSPSEPRYVDVIHDRLGDRRASLFEGRCTQESPTMSAWALDNRTVYVMARDARWSPDALSIFDSLKIPDDWPEAPSGASPSATPSPGEEEAG